MKQTNRAVKKPSSGSGHQDRTSSARSNRIEMHRYPRRLLIFTLIVLLAAFLLAGYNYLFPVILTIDTPVLAYERKSTVDYSVIVKPNAYSDQTVLGMDQVYTRAFTDAVEATFNYEFITGQPASLQYRCQIDAVLQMRDAANPQTVLLSRTFNLLPEQSGQTSQAPLLLKQNVRVNLQDYQAIVDSFAAESGLAVTFDLALVMTVHVGTALAVEDFAISDQPTLVIPMSQPQFQLTRQLPGSQSVRVWRPIRYQLALTPVPFVVYPVAAGISLLILIFLLAMTRSRKKNRFRQQLRRMMHYGRGQLMPIGDKAWEPEWCIAATDFRSMIRTARKLKHPVFCYVDWQAESPAAYFYVYYGENNYCHVFGTPSSSLPARPDLAPLTPITLEQEEPMPAPPSPAASDYASAPPADEPADTIPVLPEMDDSEEIKLTDQQAYNRKFPPGSLF